MGDINDMVINIAKGDLAKAQADFNDVLAAKVADRLEQQQAFIAQETFNPSDEDEDYADLLDDAEDDNDDYEGEYEYEDGDEDLLDDDGYEEDE
jgi:hypothetical protein